MKSIAIAAALCVLSGSVCAQSQSVANCRLKFCTVCYDKTGTHVMVGDDTLVPSCEMHGFSSTNDAITPPHPTMADDIKDILKRLDRIETLLEMK